MADYSVVDDTNLRLLTELTLHQQPALPTSDLADVAGMTTQAVNSRLDKLAEAGLVEEDTTGSGSFWWVTEAGKEAVYEDYSEPS